MQSNALTTKTGRVSELASLLRHDDHDWALRRALLQGWRGSDARQAVAAGWAQRLAPALCALGAAVGGLLGSPLLLGVFALTAALGAARDHHPFEIAYNLVARRTVRPELPANRAAHRFGCLLGAGLLGGSALAFATGSTFVGTSLATVMAVTATFVAATGICVPSILFTLLWGAERGACPTIGGALRL